MTAGLSAIAAFRLTTAEPERLIAFYRAIGFTVGEAVAISPQEMTLLGLQGGGRRISLGLGAGRLELEIFDRQGRPYPEGATAADLCFQHLALLAEDAAAAWIKARGCGARPISADGAVRLPASAGGVTAVKFRDPEGHPLEFLQFPAGDAASRIGGPRIDHSAISVSDSGASRRFYQSLGLAPGASSLNHGPTQAGLDGLADVRVEVQAMTPPRAAPHLELLGYRHPVGRRSPPSPANDVAATRILWKADRNALLRDPDGHLHVLER
ncbi:MAG: VOC family protein [Caulobacteraceae bacterium]